MVKMFANRHLRLPRSNKPHIQMSLGVWTVVTLGTPYAHLWSTAQAASDFVRKLNR